MQKNLGARKATTKAVPAYVLSAAKAQAKEAGIPYTSYLANIIGSAVVA